MRAADARAVPCWWTAARWEWRAGGASCGSLSAGSLAVQSWSHALECDPGRRRQRPGAHTSAQGQATYRLSTIHRFQLESMRATRSVHPAVTPAAGVLHPGIIDAVSCFFVEEHRYERTPISQLVLGSATFLPATYIRTARGLGASSRRASLSVSAIGTAGFTAQYQNLSTRRHYETARRPRQQPAGNSLSTFEGRHSTANARVDSRSAGSNTSTPATNLRMRFSERVGASFGRQPFCRRHPAYQPCSRRTNCIGGW